jgi:hypothetical protein
MRSILPRKLASVLVRAPVMRRSWKGLGRLLVQFRRKPEAGSFVHDMFYIKLTWGRESTGIGGCIFC